MGRQEASSIGGLKIGGNGGAAHAVHKAVNGGSELLIFVPRAAHSRDLLLKSSLAVRPVGENRLSDWITWPLGAEGRHHG
jgi:hypothetical protein